MFTSLKFSELLSSVRLGTVAESLTRRFGSSRWERAAADSRCCAHSAATGGSAALAARCSLLAARCPENLHRDTQTHMHRHTFRNNRRHILLRPPSTHRGGGMRSILKSAAARSQREGPERRVEPGSGPNCTELNSSLHFSAVAGRESLFTGPHFSKVSFEGSLFLKKYGFTYGKPYFFNIDGVAFL